MAIRSIRIVMDGVTGRLGQNQHLARSIMAIRRDGGLALAGDDRLMPEPILLGRNAEKLAALAAAHGGLAWTTDATSVLADPSVEVYFDVAATAGRVERAQRAIAAGKHIYLEKPIAADVEAALSLARAAADAGVKNGVVQDKLFLPGLAKLALLRDSGFFGTVLSAKLDFGWWVFEGTLRAPQRASWNYRKADGGGLILDMFPHWRYIVDHLVGPIRAVSCRRATRVPRRLDEAGRPYDVDVEDEAVATFELDGGVFVQVGSSWATRVKRDDLFQLQIDGTAGSAIAGLHDCRIQPAAATPKALWDVDVPPRTDFGAEWLDMPELGPHVNSYRKGWELFLRHVVEDTPFPSPLIEGAKGVQLAEGCYRSDAERRWVELPMLGTGRDGAVKSLIQAGNRMSDTYGFNLISQDLLAGFGAVGEGMSMQVTRGRRILWLAHEGPPKNFTGVDVSDPRNPKVVVQTDLPHNKVRSNSLEVCGDLMAVAYQTVEPGMTPAGIELFDISSPESPRSVGFFDCSGPYSRGVHCLWFVDGRHIHFAGGAADFQPHNQKDDQIYRIIDVADPAHPVEVGRWWQQGTRVGDDAPPPERLPIDAGFRAHNTNVYPERPDRAYVGYLDGGVYVLDIADMSRPRLVSAWNPHPPYPGFTHTVLPLFSRELLIVSDECVRDDGKDWPKLTWVVDARRETNLVPIATLPLPPVDVYGRRGGRYGSHNLHENRPGEASFKSDTLIFGTYFNGGVRVHDISNPLQPKEVAAFVPPAPAGSRVPAVQINDVFVDENMLVYAGERQKGGLYILEPTF